MSVYIYIFPFSPISASLNFHLKIKKRNVKKIFNKKNSREIPILNYATRINHETAALALHPPPLLNPDKVLDIKLKNLGSVYVRIGPLNLDNLILPFFCGKGFPLPLTGL